MLNSICLFNNKIFVPFFGGQCTSLVAYTYQQSSKDHNKAFTETSRITIPLKSSLPIKNVFLDVVDNYVVGLRSLVILIITLSDEISFFLYSDILHKQLLHIDLQISSFKESIPNSNLFISHGPTCLLVCNNILQVLPLCSNAKKICNVDFNLPLSNDSIKVLQLACFGLLLEDDPTCLLYFLSMYNTSCKQLQLYGIAVNSENCTTKYISLSIAYFFPEYYQDSLKAVEVTKTWLGLNASDLSEVTWNQNMSVLCTGAECLVFNSGMLKYCCVINSPMTNVMCVKTELYSFNKVNENLTLISEDRNVFYMVTKECNQLQLLKSWMNIGIALIGDILMKGAKQLLLLRNSDFSNWQEDCTLVDLLSFMPVDILSHSAIPDKCLNATVTGLLKKVQAGKLIIAKQESEISQKSSATVDALLRLNEYKLNTSDEFYINSFQDSLVDIILCKDENRRCKTDFSSTKQSLHLENYWTKVMNGHWILCWRFYNDDEKIICNPVMKLMIENRAIQCAQKLFIHRSKVFSLDDKSKRQINSRETFSIIMSSNIPNFFDKTIAASSILTWYEGSSNEMDNELFLPEERKILIQHQMSSTADICVADFFCRQPSHNFTVLEDLMCFKAVQQRIVLSVLSQYSDLSETERIFLCNSSISEQLVLLESFNKKCLVFKKENSSLFGVHFNINPVSPKEMEVEAYIKNDEEAYLFVHFLYQFLPEDIVILPNLCTTEELSNLKKAAVSSMKDETDLLCASFNVYNISDELRKDYSKLLSSCQAGTIIIPKESFYRIRRALAKKECLTDNIIKKISALSLYYDQ